LVLDDEYVFKLALLNEVDDNIQLNIEVHKKQFSETTKMFSYSKIMNMEVSGKMYIDNEFKLLSNTEPNLIIKLRMKKKLTQEEMKEVFKSGKSIIVN
jgi:hypothetical protein